MSVRRLLPLSVVVAVVLGLGALVPAGGPAVAGAGTAPAGAPVTVPAVDRVATTVTPQAAPTPHIIPRPNSGHAPRDAGERGGWMQELLFFLICGAIVVIGGLIWRDSRRKRRRQGRLPASGAR